ncbi:hypothetical protein DEH18_03760 [Streptomyces sp. NHF165]|uniref:hypothetical protein n=1 Tax=Streptomyces sp. NHF165 TaxID=2175864 RepID=UPI00132EFB84|nr:hypothetical protein [Streptomyces sp. NHF165]QHF93157.1 hypothetical protein DEH18_03760 [Streptomyces sp. NHF165]
MAFVAACARPHHHALRPSKLVDKGWHALIVHTTIHAQLCARLGEFVHHVPDTESHGTGRRPGAGDMDRTQRAITAAGYTPDPLLWLTARANCSQCHAGCADSPAK